MRGAEKEEAKGEEDEEDEEPLRSEEVEMETRTPENCPLISRTRHKEKKRGKIT